MVVETRRSRARSLGNEVKEMTPTPPASPPRQRRTKSTTPQRKTEAMSSSSKKKPAPQSEPKKRSNQEKPMPDTETPKTSAKKTKKEEEQESALLRSTTLSPKSQEHLSRMAADDAEITSCFEKKQNPVDQDMTMEKTSEDPTSSAGDSEEARGLLLDDASTKDENNTVAQKKNVEKEQKPTASTSENSDGGMTIEQDETEQQTQVDKVKEGNEPNEMKESELDQIERQTHADKANGDMTMELDQTEQQTQDDGIKEDKEPSETKESDSNQIERQARAEKIKEDNGPVPTKESESDQIEQQTPGNEAKEEDEPNETVVGGSQPLTVESNEESRRRQETDNVPGDEDDEGKESKEEEDSEATETDDSTKVCTEQTKDCNQNNYEPGNNSGVESQEELSEENGEKSEVALDNVVGKKFDTKADNANAEIDSKVLKADNDSDQYPKNRRRRRNKKTQNELTRVLPGYTAPLRLTTAFSGTKPVSSATSSSALEDMRRKALREDTTSKKLKQSARLMTQRSTTGNLTASYCESHASYHKKKKRPASATETAGPGWFNMKPTPVTEGVERDMALIRNRNYLDPKRFYKSADQTRPGAKPLVQAGTVIEGPTEFYSSRLTKKQRRSNLVDEIMADPESSQWAQQKYKTMQQTKDAAARKWGKKIKNRQDYRKTK